MTYNVEVEVQMPQFGQVFVEADSPEAAQALVQAAIDKDEWGCWVWQNAENWLSSYEEAHDFKTSGEVSEAAGWVRLTNQENWQDA